MPSNEPLKVVQRALFRAYGDVILYTPHFPPYRITFAATLLRVPIRAFITLSFGDRELERIESLDLRGISAKKSGRFLLNFGGRRKCGS